MAYCDVTANVYLSAAYFTLLNALSKIEVKRKFISIDMANGETERVNGF